MSWALVYFGKDDSYASVPVSSITAENPEEKTTVGVRWTTFNPETSENESNVYDAKVIKIGAEREVKRKELEFVAKLKEAREKEKLQRPRERKATEKRRAMETCEVAQLSPKKKSKTINKKDKTVSKKGMKHKASTDGKQAEQKTSSGKQQKQDVDKNSPSKVAKGKKPGLSKEKKLQIEKAKNNAIRETTAQYFAEHFNRSSTASTGDTSPTEYSPNKCVKHSCDTTSVSPMCPSPHTKLSSSAMPCTYGAYATPVSKVEINSQFQSQSGPRPTAQKQESFLDLLNDSDSDVTMHDLDTNTTTGGVIAAAMQPLYHDDDESEVYTQQPAEIPKQVYTQLPAEIPKQVYTQLPAEIPKQVYTQPAKISKQVYTQQPAEISKQVYTQQPAEISKQDYVMIPKPPPEVCNYLKEVFQILTEAKPTTAEHIKVEPYEKGVVGGQPHLSKSPTAGVTSTSPVLGCDPNMQTTGSLEEFTELVPKSGVMIPIPTISTILAEARQEPKKLFLKLVDHFFPAEVRAVSTASSRSTNGKMPLDQNIVQAIKSNNMQKMTSCLL